MNESQSLPESQILTVEHLSKSFGFGREHVQAVEDLSFELKRGEVFGFVGPDGAGKSTTIRMLCTVIPPDAGTVTLLGFDLVRQRTKIRRKIGYLSQRFSLYGDLTVSENIDFFAEIHGVRQYHERKHELLEFMRLERFRDRLAQQLSGGMKQKLALACTLIHTPEIIFLDEPTTGVDPVSRRDFWWILARLQKEGLTIIISTPYIDEAERCHRVAFMSNGRIIKCDQPRAIKNSLRDHLLEVVCDDVRKARQILIGQSQVSDIQAFGDRLHLHSPAVLSPEQVRATLEANGVIVQDMRSVLPSLEDAFIHYLQENSEVQEIHS
ncbi:ABC transporter ATP-binding protein [bacterium]|nr:ABC transporter ATP-binding protein [bacterium]